MENLFTDPETERIRNEGGTLDLGPWQLQLPRTFGFCGGVLRAVQTLYDAVRQRAGRRFWLLGPIIHNDTVNQAFRELGVTILPESRIADVLTVASPEDVVIIPAFGIPLDLDTRLRSAVAAPANIVDTTCRDVRRIWRFVLQASADRATVVVHGKPNHPETRATVSRALTPGNAVVIVRDLAAAGIFTRAVAEQDAALLPPNRVLNPTKLDFRNMAVVNQTTMLYEETRRIESGLAAAVDRLGGKLRTAETICKATQRRQEAATALCRQGCDTVLVLGGFASSNTTQLFLLASRYGPAYFIRDAQALNADSVEHFLPDQACTAVTRHWLPPAGGRIGLLAGASCPASDVGDVIRKLRQLARA